MFFSVLSTSNLFSSSGENVETSGTRNVARIKTATAPRAPRLIRQIFASPRLGSNFFNEISVAVAAD